MGGVGGVAGGKCLTKAVIDEGMAVVLATARKRGRGTPRGLLEPKSRAGGASSSTEELQEKFVLDDKFNIIGSYMYTRNMGT